MSIKFGYTPYSQVIRSSTDPDFSSDRKIFNYAKNTPQFRYGDVSYEQFLEKYSPQNKIGRKFAAIPAAFIAGVIKVVYHFAQVIFKGLWKAPFDKGHYLKAKGFSIARDFEEAFGWLTCLFWGDKRGTYYLQEAKFQKTCYDCFAGGATFSSNISPFFGFCGARMSVHGVMVHDKAKETSLLDYKKAPTDEREDLVNGFLVQDAAKNLGGTGRSLDAFVDQAPDEMLELLTFQDLVIFQGKPERSKLPFALMSDEEFGVLTVAKLNEKMTKYGKIANRNRQEWKIDQLQFIQARLAILPSAEVVEGREDIPEDEKVDKEKIEDLDDDINALRLRDLASLSAVDIAKSKNDLFPLAFAFFTNDQIHKIKLSDPAIFIESSEEEGATSCDSEENDSSQLPISDEIKKKAFNLIVKRNAILFIALDEAQLKKRLELFDDEDVVEAIHEGLLTGRVLKYLSDEQVDALKLCKLRKEQIEKIFSWSTDEERAKQEERFKQLDPKEVQELLRLGLLTNGRLLKLISGPQLGGIQFSSLVGEGGLKPETLKSILENTFSYGYNDEAGKAYQMERFSGLPAKEVQELLRLGVLTNGRLLKLISGPQLGGIQFSSLLGEEEGDLNLEAVQGILEDAFHYYSNNEDSKAYQAERFGHLPAKEVQELLRLGLLRGGRLFKLISGPQLGGIQFSSLLGEEEGDLNLEAVQGILEDAFHYYSNNEDSKAYQAERFSHLPAEEVQELLRLGLLRGGMLFKLISGPQLGGIQFSSLLGEKEGDLNLKAVQGILEDAFHYYSNDEDSKAYQAERFGHLPAKEVQELLRLGVLTNGMLLKLISGPQLGGIQFSSLLGEKEGDLNLKAVQGILEDAFHYYSNDEDSKAYQAERFGHLPAKEVQELLRLGVLTNGMLLKLISGPQLGGIQFSSLVGKKEGDLNLEAVQGILEDAFHYYSNDEDSKAYQAERFGRLPAEEVQELLRLGLLKSDNLLKLLSIKQIQAFDFSVSAMPQEIVNILFPPCSLEDLRKKHSYKGYSYFSVNGKVLDDRRGVLCNFTEEQLEQKAQEQQRKNKALLEQLSNEQREQLEPRLYQEDDSSGSDEGDLNKDSPQHDLLFSPQHDLLFSPDQLF